MPILKEYPYEYMRYIEDKKARNEMLDNKEVVVYDADNDINASAVMSLATQ